MYYSEKRFFLFPVSLQYVFGALPELAHLDGLHFDKRDVSSVNYCNSDRCVVSSLTPL